MLYKYVSIEGIIGAGKTMLARYLSERYGAQLLLEAFEENKSLPDFYKDPAAHALETENFFLEQRYRQLSGLAADATCVSDYHFGKCLVFARITLSKEAAENFEKRFRERYARIRKPNLLLYLDTPVEKAMENIQHRGRAYEKNIPENYLAELQKGYMDLFSELPGQRIVVVDMAGIDFAQPATYYTGIEKILAQEHPVGISRIAL